MNDYYPLIARAVERLDRSTGETRRAVYERARKAIAQLLSNPPALLDADITKERIALGKCARDHRQSQHCHHDEETATPARARDIIVMMIGAVSSANCDGLDICVVMVIGRGGQEY